MVSNSYAKAYTEVYEILNHLNVEEISKIPQEKIDFYNKNRDKDYKFKINTAISLEEQEFSRKTYAIIISLFRDYIATDNQKATVDNILKHNQEINEEEKIEKYNPDKIFKTKIKENINVITDNNLPLEAKKENFFTNIINYIKKWFNK